MQSIPDGLVAVVKRDCPTCVMVEPVLRQLAAADTPLTVLTQDDPTFPSEIPGSSAPSTLGSRSSRRFYASSMAAR